MMTRNTDPMDPKGLISESYKMDGISLGECRSIFLDWALSLPEDMDQITAIKTLHAAHAADSPEHPMSEVLTEGMLQTATPKRRGGWRSRTRN